MNSAILANTEAISGKADTGHTHTKSQITDFPTSLKNPNALTVNGKTYDGSTAVDAGVQKIENGGTGVTTQADINKAFIGNLEAGESDVTDGTEFVSSYASDNGFSDTNVAVNIPYRRKFIKVWNYIKGKVKAVLGLDETSLTTKTITATNVKATATLKGNSITSDTLITAKSDITAGGNITATNKVRATTIIADKADVNNSITTANVFSNRITTINITADDSITATNAVRAKTITADDSITATNAVSAKTITADDSITANEFKVGNRQQSIEYRSKSFCGYKMHEVQANALYIEGRESEAGDSGGLAITNDSVTVFGAGDTNGVFRVVNEDKAGDGSATAPSIFNIFKDGKVTMTNRLTAPSATIGGRPAITGSYSNGVLNLYTN